MKIFGIHIGSHSRSEKSESKKDKVSDVAQSKLKESSKDVTPISLGSRISSWIKTEFWSFVDSFYLPKSVMIKPPLSNTISKDKINPHKMPIHDFEIDETVAVKVSNNHYKTIRIAGLKADEENHGNDVVFSSEGEKIPINALFKINTLDQTNLITNRAGKIAIMKEVGLPVISPRNISKGDILIQKSDNLIVEVIEVNNEMFTVFDGRKNVRLPMTEFYNFKTDRESILDRTLDTSQIDFFKEEVNVGELVAYRYKNISTNPNLDDRAPPQYRTETERVAQAPIYKLVKVVEIYPDIIVDNGITHFKAEPSDIFGTNVDTHKLGDIISKNYLDNKELLFDDIDLNQKMAIYENGNYKIVEIKNKAQTYALVNDGSVTRWVPILGLRKLKS